MSDVVWLSILETMDNRFRDYRSTATEGLRAKQHVAGDMNWQGDIVPDFAIPLTVRPGSEKTRQLGEINLLPGRFLLVGPKTAAVLAGHDLGEGALHPVAVEDGSGNTISEHEYFFWNIGNKLTHFRPDSSRNLQKSNYGNEKPGEHVYFPPVIPEDDTIAFSKECLSGPSAWREKYLASGTVLSNRLVNELKAAKLDKAFELVRCRVV